MHVADKATAIAAATAVLNVTMLFLFEFTIASTIINTIMVLAIWWMYIQIQSMWDSKLNLEDKYRNACVLLYKVEHTKYDKLTQEAVENHNQFP